jgi:hypothetical protein
MAPNSRTYFVGFHHGEVGCVLQGHKKGPNMRLEGDSFKLSKKERKGLLLQLIGDSTQFLEIHKQGVTKKDQGELPGPVAKILKIYEDVFK